MSLPTQPPQDPLPFARDATSRPYGPDLPPGSYVFVQDEPGTVFVLRETPAGHQHPKVLGGGSPAAAAGGLLIGPDGVIMEVDNYSGTFRFGPDILPQVRAALERQGGVVRPGVERAFPY